MCSSYFLEDSPSLENIAYAAGRSRLAHHMVNFLGRPFVSKGRVKPSDIVPVLAPDRKGEVSIFPMIWGYTSKSSIITTAMLESARESRLFRDSWERRRCLIPASWYYDYEHLQISRDPSAAGSANTQLPEAIRPRTGADGSRKGQKYMIQPAGTTHMLMAGLYRIEESGDTKFPHFVILTRDAAEEISFIHDRMPVMLDPAQPLPASFFANDDLADRQSHIQQWINPGTMPWILDRVMDSAATDIVFEKC